MHIFPFLPHSRLATVVTDATIRSPTSEVSPPYELTVWASDLAVLVAVVVVVGVAATDCEVAAAVAGREESFASVYVMILKLALPFRDRI